VARGLTDLAGMNPGRFNPGEDCVRIDLLFKPLPNVVNDDDGKILDDNDEADGREELEPGDKAAVSA
jgi:hypothetical protein